MTRRALTVLVVLVGIVVWSSGPSFASAPAAFGYDDIELVADPARLLALPTTTGVAQVAHAYDVSTVASVDDRTSAAAETASALLNGVRDESVSLPIYDPGPSTTSSRSVVATNTANDVLRFGTKDSWGNLNTLDDHFARHGADFGATSADDYARQAFEFLQQPGTLTKIDPKTGVIRVYDPATEAFGAYNPTGTTRTFYIPDPAKHGYPTNLDYWNAQPG